MPRLPIFRSTLPLAAAMFCVAIASPALARDGQFFLRGELGRADTDFDLGTTETQDNERIYAARAGYYFNRHFAVEGFYTKLNDDRVVELPGLFTLDTEIHAAGVGMAGKKRFGEDRGFFIQARGGVARYKGSTTAASNPCMGPLPCFFVTRSEDSQTGGYFGIGAGYDFNDNIGIGANYDAYRFEFDGIDTDTRVLTAAVEIRF